VRETLERIVEEELRPRLRGVIHAYAFWVALGAGAVLIAIANGARARTGATVYAIGLCALFAGSAVYHRWRWDPRWRPLLRRIDHSTIFVFIAASYTPIALLARARLRNGEALAHHRIIDEGVLVAVGAERLRMLLRRRPALEQEHGAVTRQLAGDNAARRAAPDDDVIVRGAHLRVTSRVRPRHFWASPRP